MSTEPEVQESSGAVREIETELDRVLARRKEEIEAALDSRIRQEREAARRRLEEIEREIARGKEAVAEFESTLSRLEAERQEISREIRERIDRALGHQRAVEDLTRRTAEEIQAVRDLHARLEELRLKTSERAGFLKADLRERFGIVAEMPPDSSTGASGGDTGGLNLDRELEKLRRIKALLKLESEGDDGDPEPEILAAADAADPVEPADPARMPELADLIAEEDASMEAGPEMSAAPDASPLPEPVSSGAPGDLSETVPAGAEPEDEDAAAALSARLAAFQRTEPANGSGEIPYFNNGSKTVLDVRGLLRNAERTLEEARRLTLKLGLAESPKEQFFIKQELINWQEGLRKLIQRSLRICGKRGCSLPSRTHDVLNLKTLKDLEDDLGFANWSQPADFAAFEARFRDLRTAFEAALSPPASYLRSLLDDLGVEA